jgi:ribosome biogenesis GTPase
MGLDVLGWNERWQEKFAALDVEGLVPGRVIGEHRSHFQVAIEVTELSAGTAGRLRKAAKERSDLPGVGDFVAVRPPAGDGPATIEAVLPRLSALVRKASGESRPQLLAANVDVVFIMTTPDNDLNLPRLERYLALVRDSGASPVIVVNKADLTQDALEITGRIAAIAPGVPIHVVSARGRVGIEELERFFDGNRTIAFVGSSGVGKSTLTNLLLGRSAQATQEVRAHDSRGRHTTTHRQLFTRPEGGSIIDTPGMRSLEVWNPPAETADGFEDIEALATQCKFRDCRHGSEPACAVRAAVERGEVDAARAAAYATRTGASKLGARSRPTRGT